MRSRVFASPSWYGQPERRPLRFLGLIVKNGTFGPDRALVFPLGGRGSPETATGVQFNDTGMFFLKFFQAPACPRCKSSAVRRSQTRVIDWFSLLFLLPLRCRVCSKRFRVLRPAAALLSNPDTFYRVAGTRTSNHNFETMV